MATSVIHFTIMHDCEPRTNYDKVCSCVPTGDEDKAIAVNLLTLRGNLGYTAMLQPRAVSCEGKVSRHLNRHASLVALVSGVKSVLEAEEYDLKSLINPHTISNPAKTMNKPKVRRRHPSLCGAQASCRFTPHMRAGKSL